MSFVYIGRGGGGAMTYVFGGLFVIVMVGMLVMALAGGGRASKVKINEERRDYLRYLANLRKQVRQTGEGQRAALALVRPEPVDLWTLAASPRLWERRRSDPEFGQVRLGTGPQRLAAPLRAPQTVPLEDLDPVSSTSLRHFIRAYATVPRLPVAISLRAFARVAVAGERARVLDLVRAMLAQAATFHAPNDLRVGVCVAADRRGEWEWAKWLPHAQDTTATDAVGPVRLVANNLDTLADLLAADLGERPVFTKDPGMGFDRPHVVVVIDGGRTHGDSRIGGRHGVTVIEVLAEDAPAPDQPDLTTLWLRLENDRLGMVVAEESEPRVAVLGTPDRFDFGSTEALARLLTPRFQGGKATSANPVPSVFGLAGLIGLDDPRDVDPKITWRPRAPRDRLRLPLGLDESGQPVHLDLKESAEGGMGPHGLVIGATGSGKSELLRTLVSGLAVTHSSETLNLALIDFKGGATFAGMAGLPHVCAVITNLSDDLTLVDRMADAINGEVLRRQELLRSAGNFASVRDYERAREGGADLKPLPSLLLIIDEFSELLSSRPEFIDLFVMIGRLGRSLAIHLLLASQRLEEGRLRGLEAHLSYRIGLRTFSAAESRTVLGVPDAYHLPAIPGSAYLKSDTETLTRLKAAYVSGPLPPRIAGPGAPAAPGRAVLLFSLDRVEPDDNTMPSVLSPVVQAKPSKETVMQAMLSRLSGHGPAAHQIWLPPLSDPPTLDQLLPALGTDPQRGLCPTGWTGNGNLTVPVAIVDKPFEQRRDLLWLDLAGAAGHVLVLGAPQSGKSTMLRTLVASLALTHTPNEVQFFLLDMGGGGLGPVAGLPHVSGHGVRRDQERCRRVVAEVASLLVQREELFAEHGIDSPAEFRRRRAELTESGDEAGREFGDVFLVVDDFATLREEYEGLEGTINRLAARGLGFGIHVVISANRWMTVRAQLLDAIGTKLELRLGDPSDSMVDRKAARNVPETPGRGLSPDGLHSLVALPRLDGERDTATLAAGTVDLVRRISEAWPGKPAPPVRLLPREVPFESLAVPAGRVIPLGVAESDLQPVTLDFTAEPHFLAFADVGCGKTALLRTIARGITSRYAPGEAAIIVVDYRRGLLDAVQGKQLLGYAGSASVLDSFMVEAVEALRLRLPGPDTDPERLRRRDWWAGPELFVLVDDYELLTGTGQNNPLLRLMEFLPQARDIGLHLVVVRGIGGAGRALYDPLLMRIKELGSPGLVMSGNRDEGVLLGTVRPSPQPPGRGVLVSRRTETELVQVGWTPPVG
jgi:S-DNA-T family DNA segregation ATPase FtsK/SpoIIIE